MREEIQNVKKEVEEERKRIDEEVQETIEKANSNVEVQNEDELKTGEVTVEAMKRDREAQVIRIGKRV